MFASFRLFRNISTAVLGRNENFKITNLLNIVILRYFSDFTAILYIMSTTSILNWIMEDYMKKKTIIDI